MKRKKLLKTSSIVLVLALLMSTLLFAFADTNTNAPTDSANNGWIKKTPMFTGRHVFETIVLNGKIYAIGGSNNAGLSSVEVYDPTANTWKTLASMNNSRYYFQAVAVDGKIYAIGGEDSYSSMEVYDPKTDKWTTKASMGASRYIFKAQVINGKIYAIGGDGSYNSIEVYDPNTDKWTTKASMHQNGRFWDQTEVIDGKIYVIGGTCESIEVYDPVTDIWTTKASMSTPRAEFQTVVIDGKIYAIGGRNNTKSTVISSVEEYDPATDKWIIKASMKTPRERFEAVVLNGKIYAIGGMDINGNSLSSAERYDVNSDTWDTVSPMSTMRSYFQAKVVDETIYAIGGYNGSIQSTVEAYTPEPTQSPTLTVIPSSDKVKINDQFTTTVAIHKGTNICAEDIKLTYDTNLFEYVGAEAQTGLKIQKEDSTTTPGTIRLIVSCLGKDNAATGDKDLITLKFKAKKPGQGKVDITKGRIADNATLEMDVADADCGEATITVESNKDVNRSGDVTLLDLGIDGYYYGSDAKDTDSTKYDADVMPNGKIDDDDLNEITQGILSNSKYPNN
ncbi:MAG TPA: kelch repeat-containing protein [Oscillospiraceae bacterium]|nr:kelch repeat-containing protein [Oscillospiraceae bacterium]